MDRRNSEKRSDDPEKIAGKSAANRKKNGENNRCGVRRAAGRDGKLYMPGGRYYRRPGCHGSLP